MDSTSSHSLARHWTLDPGIAFLNHGSFGACPGPILSVQQQLRDRIERQPVQFFVRDLEGLLDEARASLAAFLGADASDLALVPSATAGVNAVLRSLELKPGDELLTTNHEYNACRNVLEFVAERAGATVVVAEIPFPLESSQQAAAVILDAVTPRTRLALLDHITSQSALILPIEVLTTALADFDIPVLVDGAHAPGMVPVDLNKLGAAYYTGNCHKWLCAPKGSGFLHVNHDYQASVRPAIISHGANTTRRDRSRFLIEFDWTGTTDPTAVLSVPAALEFMGSLLPGGWDAVRERNRSLALAARPLLCTALGLEPPCPDDMIGAIASLPLPSGSAKPLTSPLYADPMQDTLLERYGIEVPVIPWPAVPQRLVRLSTQVYNTLDEYQRLADALRELFPNGSRG
jgi:isopenicillin-N epimerase